ncbi:MAG: haloalkane dehalogenase [Alphaproteobacteria bacterium]|jgi:haloalkane dehalogenase|nr:haloalkane dehalogenase [Alphaproteobacteria bacterium]MBU2041164.1 haloalkane dehalogenase [Alphaproteobacteria bacterium]MBU2125531.1 haloalkane dehalogenase [Alphaproteobacteria bacterium]MBU2208510.1 haloalkane dehalogenase [Alphaproteobacteria bacterium]MBU2289925.1 haloalkane dehalogenase [Alphaproteobacteria bacterium]
MTRPRFTRRQIGFGAAGASLALGCTGLDLSRGEDIRRSKKFVRLSDGVQMAYVEAGSGAPIVFLHGNPTSSYLWRNIIPYVSGRGRCIAPDLVGMGDSDKLPNPGPGVYTFAEHRRRLDEFLDRIGVGNYVTLVLHDWGGPLGFDWAARHSARVRAVAFMETFVVSMNDANTPRFSLDFFTRFRGPEAELEVLEGNAFVETVLLRQFPGMSEADKAEYRRPFREAGEGRRPTLEWPRQVPINGDPADVHAAFSGGLGFMAASDVPKLFIRGDPGALISNGREAVCRAWPSVTERVVPGRHYLPEESPDEIGRHLADWHANLG